MLLSKIHILATVTSASEGRECSTVGVSTGRQVFAEYYSLDNSSHILVHTVLIKYYKCICASVIPSMLGNLLGLFHQNLSHDTQNLYAPALYTVSIDIKMTLPYLDQVS